MKLRPPTMLLGCLLLLLAACGQKGDLYLPEEPAPAGKTAHDTRAD